MEKSSITTKVAFNKVELDERDINAAVDVLRSSSLVQGKRVREFEMMIEEKFSIENAILVNSGTSALHLSLLALGVGPGDTVAVPSFTFVGSVNSIHFTGAKPVFIDIDASTFQISIDDLYKKIDGTTKAIMPVHLFGAAAEIDKIIAIAQEGGKDIFVVEDAAQAIGGMYMSRYLGTLGNMGCFSLYATKNISSIEGGVILSSSGALADKTRFYRNQGMRRSYEYMDYGLNNRMTEVQAAIGMSQFTRLDKINRRRREIARSYKNRIKNDNVLLPYVDDKINYHVYHQFTLRIPNNRRTDFIAHMEKHNVEVKIIYQTPIHMSKPYIASYSSLPVTEKIVKQVVSLPIHNRLSNSEVDTVIETVNSWK